MDIIIYEQTYILYKRDNKDYSIILKSEEYIYMASWQAAGKLKRRVSTKMLKGKPSTMPSIVRFLCVKTLESCRKKIFIGR